jgi:type II secretory pathway pseudopilin PulG
MIVVTIIGILIMMLVPAISTAVVAVRIKAATQHIEELDICVQTYLQAYGDYPPSEPTATWRLGSAQPNYKPLLRNLDISQGASVQFDVTQGATSSGTQGGVLGGGLLGYFLLGPTGNGWDPSIFFCSNCGASFTIGSLNNFLLSGCNSVSPSSMNCQSHFAYTCGTVRWIPPPAVEMLVGKTPIATYNGGTALNPPFYYLEDGFPIGGDCAFGGTIQYIRARRNAAAPYDVTTTRCDITSGNVVNNFDSKPATDTTTGLYGTKISGASYYRLMSQCKAPYALISSGPDRVFGYYYMLNNKLVQDATNGQCDDITSFPHD